MSGQRSAGASVPSLLLSTEKVTVSHRSRDAYVYVRQSTPSQMVHHTESLARQYELRERAVMLGWPAHQGVVIDADLGRSGAQSAGRTGFKELVADVGLGKVGIVLGIEVSRLARNNADWYQLLDLCAITDTLIADADGVYHPADFNDRLVLGLKGTMSEAELHLIRSRLTAGLKHKAAKGQLRQGLPVGLDYDEDDKVVLCADEAVRGAITTVFRRFDELGSARQVLIRLREDGVLLPRRRNGAKRIFWAQATYPAVHDLLTNPAYAGAFVFGRTRTEKRVDPDTGQGHRQLGGACCGGDDRLGCSGWGGAGVGGGRRAVVCGVPLPCGDHQPWCVAVPPFPVELARGRRADAPTRDRGLPRNGAAVVCQVRANLRQRATSPAAPPR